VSAESVANGKVASARPAWCFSAWWPGNLALWLGCWAATL